MWNKNFAKNYHKENLIEKKYILEPEIKNILRSNKWERLIDIGCGSGYYCRIVASKNKRIVGVDKNEHQINIAKHEEEKRPHGIEYIKSDITRMKSVKNNNFDVALLNFVLVEVSSPSKINKILKESYRVLRKNGILLIGQVHPHHINKKSRILEKRICKKSQCYFNNASKAVSKTLLENGKYLFFHNDYHYSLEFILNSLEEAGFGHVRIKELSYKENFPTHIIIIAKKVK